jgi:hypothetical protein
VVGIAQKKLVRYLKKTSEHNQIVSHGCRKLHGTIELSNVTSEKLNILHILISGRFTMSATIMTRESFLKGQDVQWICKPFRQEIKLNKSYRI